MSAIQAHQQRQERVQEMMSGRSRAYEATTLRREYLKTRPSFADRLFAGSVLGFLSMRPDLTSDLAHHEIEDAKWSLYDAWVDVGHAMSVAMRDHMDANEAKNVAKPHAG